MPAYAIIGGQWGDEGKGKVVDFLAENADVVARFNGGNNAGHTVINDLGEFKFHIIPVGILRKSVTPVIGNGVVVDPDALLEEVGVLESRSVDVSRLLISERAHVIMPYHITLDHLEENLRAEGEGVIGTTGRGIGPVYMDKSSRIGIRMADLLDENGLLSKLSFIVERKNSLITKVYGGDPISLDEMYAKCREWGKILKPFIGPTESVIQEMLANDSRLLLEGAQGTMLDLDHGTYPYVTSSSPTVGGACIGLGISPRYIHEVAGVYKSYTTRVGSGALPTELDNEVGEAIRASGVGVRHYYRKAATVWLVRWSGGPVRRRHQRHDLSNTDASGRPWTASHPSSCALPTRSTARLLTAFPAARRRWRCASRSTRSSPAGTRPQPAPATSRTCRRERWTTSGVLRSSWAVPSA